MQLACAIVCTGYVVFHCALLAARFLIWCFCKNGLKLGCYGETEAALFNIQHPTLPPRRSHDTNGALVAVVTLRTNETLTSGKI